MPLEFIANDSIPKIKRTSKLDKSSDWQALVEILDKGLPSGKSVAISFSDATLRLFKNDAAKTTQAFVLRLRKEFRYRYRIRLIRGRIFVSRLEKK